MSVRIMTMVWGCELGGPTVKAVAMKMADCAHDNGKNAWPSVRHIARHTEVSERSVQYAIRELCRRGLLRLERPGGGVKSSVYAFDLDALAALHRETQAKWDAQDARTEKGTGAKSAPVQPVHPTGATGAPPRCNPCTLTIIEPSIEPSNTPPSPSQARGRPRKPKSLLPEDWRLPDGWRAWAKAHCPGRALWISSEADKFRDHFLGTAGRKADWAAAWRLWWRRACEAPAPRGKTRAGGRGAVTARDTEEPAHVYGLRMWREGKWVPDAETIERMRHEGKWSAEDIAAAQRERAA